MTWIANVLILIGMYLIGRKWRVCFVFSGLGESIWCVSSALEGRYDLAFICFVFVMGCGVNYYRWGRDE